MLFSSVPSVSFLLISQCSLVLISHSFIVSFVERSSINYPSFLGSLLLDFVSIEKELSSQFLPVK